MMKKRIDFSGKLEVHYCSICNVKTYDWENHIMTKKHKKLIKDIPYDPIIINSYMGCKITPLLQYLPKVKSKKQEFKVHKEKNNNHALSKAGGKSEI